MRISSNLFFKTGLNSINAQQSDLVHLYKQVGSGKRMVTPSDDPLAAAQAINVSQTLAMSERYAANRQVASRNLGMQENVLNSVTLQLQDVKTRLIEAGNGSWADIDRATLAEVLETARDGLLNLANSTDGNGQYLFSGALGKTAAFSDTGVYQGSDHARLIQVDQTRQIDSADIGSNIFSRAAPGTVGYVVVAGENNGDTGGDARFGVVTVTDTSGPAYGNDVRIEFTSATEYEVYINGVAAGTETYDPTTGVVLGGAYGVEMKLTGGPSAGDEFRLATLQSSMSSDDLNLFTALDDIIASLRTPTDGPVSEANLENSLRSAMQRVDVIYNNVLSVRASAGTRMNEIDALQANGGMRIMEYKGQLSELEDLDYYTAITQLQLRTTALEAAATAFQKIQNTSLFNLNARG